MKYQILEGDNRETLKTLADNSIDAIVTDPPYGIDFLGKSWDANTGALETYAECLRVLKPGGHILAFSAARTYHHLAVTLEQAGFEIRDQIMWIYSSGFPKSQDIGKSIQRSMGVKESKKYKTNAPRVGGDGEFGADGTKEQVVCTSPEAVEWSGWGTALKPAHEPIALARKPIKLSIAKNAQQWGTGALNIDATRVPYVDEKDIKSAKGFGESVERNGGPLFQGTDQKKNMPKAQVGPVYGAAIGGADPFNIRDEHQQYEPNQQGRFPSNVIGEILQADYQKYFYCPKVSRKERHIGYDTDDIYTATNMLDEMKGYYLDTQGNPDPTRKDNGRMIWLPHTGVIYSHTLKEEYKMWKGNNTGIVSRTEMIEKMGGYWANEQGQPKQEGEESKMCWTPETGLIFAHGVTHEYAKWCEKNNIPQGNVGNNHPTVKPIELMKYLIKLITPPGGVVLDPFNGSGSTGCAAVELGFEYIGCELDPVYVEIAKRRIEAWANKDSVDNNFEALFSAT